MVIKEITPKQKKVLEFIYDSVFNEGFPPTLSDLKEKMGVSSNQSALNFLNALEKKGFIKRREGQARSITILPLGLEILGKKSLMPILGATSAGSPIETIEISGEWQEIPGEVARLKQEVFLLKISGDSMINAGIDDGDVVLVQNQKEFISGDIVFAQIGDGSTVKRFISDDKPPYVYLKPENPNHKVIPFNDETEIKGKVISILKNNYWKPVK
ncbi:repressor LexA [Candidatus Azambacteria bacterium]|nr:repressor LexA [Candidatus Azambacteria bacterium]